MGIVTVMSKLSADAFGIRPEDKITCVGVNPNVFARCVLDLHSNKSAWTEMQQNGFEFIKKTHNYDEIKKVWAKIIDDGKKIRAESSHDRQLKEEKCPEGERDYVEKYPDIKRALRKKGGKYTSAFHHYRVAGKKEGRVYTCDEVLGGFGHEKFFALHSKLKEVQCPEGDHNYLEQYPDVMVAMKEKKSFKSAFHHYQKLGRKQGRIYTCGLSLELLG